MGEVGDHDKAVESVCLLRREIMNKLWNLCDFVRRKILKKLWNLSD